jgi:polyhydroxyalkanoate synthesis regulator phasin
MPDSVDQQDAKGDSLWPENYFNYFTEIEEHFQRARGTSLFLLSPLDWALIENWKNAGVPLEAVLRGIDETLEKWRSRKVKTRRVNSLAYCAQAVLEIAQRLSGTGSVRARERSTDAPFQVSEIREHLNRAASAFASKQNASYQQLASTLQELAHQAEVHSQDLEDLERRLTALEDKAVAIARTVLSDEALLEIRRQLDSDLSPYRGKMSADQITMLARRYLDTRVLEREQLPRLSLFYLH